MAHTNKQPVYDICYSIARIITSGALLEPLLRSAVAFVVVGRIVNTAVVIVCCSTAVMIVGCPSSPELSSK